MPDLGGKPEMGESSLSDKMKVEISKGELFRKVPEITLYFWIIKVLCTTVGETASDFLNTSLSLGLTGISIIMGIFLVTVLYFQFRFKKYKPSIYWLAVVLISIVGTLITDNLTDNFGVGLETTTAIFGVGLALVFALWYKREKTLSIHTIYTRRREAFYWLAILFTFALGTAAGDLMAESLNLGYLVSAVIFGALIAIVAVSHLRFKLNAVLAFWVAYILTRPLGASLGDYLSQSVADGGLGLGTAITSGLFLVTILVTVAYLAITKIDAIGTAGDGQGFWGRLINVTTKKKFMTEEAKPSEEANGPDHKSKIPFKLIAGYVTVALLFSAIGLMIPKGQATGLIISQSPILAANDAGAKATDYINKYLLQPGYMASLINASESDGLYLINLKIASNNGSTIYKSYVTDDGNLLFVNSVDISKAPAAKQTTVAQTTTTVPKTDKPNVKMFVMAFCPYGKQAEAGLGPAIAAIGADKISFEPHFVIYSNYQGGGSNYCFDNASEYCSMHGINETREDIRQMVIWKYWPDKWWAYVNQVDAQASPANIESKWAGIANSVGLSSSEIQQKFDSEALTLLANEAALNAKYSVRGSPTVLINDVQYSGGRTPANFQSGICGAFNTSPAGCSSVVNATASTNAPAGGCGTTA